MNKPLSFLCCLLLQNALGQSLPPPTHSNVSYGAHERHVLDFWQAKSEKPAPLLIFIHGGGWAGGDKSDLPKKLLDYMLNHGISVASINYRFTSMVVMPAPLHDAARAVQFLRHKAGEWRFDPQRFGGYGISAGACTVLWLAFHDDLARTDDAAPMSRLSTRLQAGVGLSPPTILEPEQMIAWVGEKVMEHPAIPRCVGVKTWQEVRQHPELWRDLLLECSVLPHLSAEDPPFLLSYPRVDPLPAASAGSAIHHAIFGVKLKEKADAAGVSCILRIQEQGDATPEPEPFILKHLTQK